MITLRNFLFVFASLLVSSEVVSQNISDLPANSFPFNFAGQTVMEFDNRYEGVRGVYTFFEEFWPGTIELTKGKFANVLLNYDACQDQVLARHERIQGIVQLRKDMVDRFTLIRSDGNEFRFVKKVIDGAPVFLLEIASDSMSMYCRIKKTIKKADLGGAYNISEEKFDEFVTGHTYYVEKKPKLLISIQNSRKGVLKAFPEYEKQLSTFFKNNKLDFNDYHQMKVLSVYLNSLIKQG